MNAHVLTKNGWQFIDSSNMTEHLPAGVYEPRFDYHEGLFLYRAVAWDTDRPIDLPNPTSRAARALASRFFHREFRTQLQRMQVGERLAFLLWGVPGSGKSICLRQLTEDAIAQDWVVLYGWSNYVVDAIHSIRKIEPDRGIMLAIEELDTTLKRPADEEDAVYPYDFDAENALLQLLDGNAAIQGILVVMTTNHLRNIPARVFQRARRITNQFEFVAPTRAERLAFFAHHFALAGVEVHEEIELRSLGYNLELWADRTEGLTLDQCAALVIAVAGYGQDFATVHADFASRIKARKSGNDESDEETAT